VRDDDDRDDACVRSCCPGRTAYAVADPSKDEVPKRLGLLRPAGFIRWPPVNQPASSIIWGQAGRSKNAHIIY
jgi:hypothetical protein